MADTFLEDLRIVKEMMDKFISQDHITKGLQQITDIGITGWEKWWRKLPRQEDNSKVECLCAR